MKVALQFTVSVVALIQEKLMQCDLDKAEILHSITEVIGMTIL